MRKHKAFIFDFLNYIKNHIAESSNNRTRTFLLPLLIFNRESTNITRQISNKIIVDKYL